MNQMYIKSNDEMKPLSKNTVYDIKDGTFLIFCAKEHEVEVQFVKLEEDDTADWTEKLKPKVVTNSVRFSFYITRYLLV